VTEIISIPRSYVFSRIWLNLFSFSSKSMSTAPGQPNGLEILADYGLTADLFYGREWPIRS